MSGLVITRAEDEHTIINGSNKKTDKDDDDNNKLTILNPAKKKGNDNEKNKEIGEVSSNNDDNNNNGDGSNFKRHDRTTSPFTKIQNDLESLVDELEIKDEQSKRALLKNRQIADNNANTTTIAITTTIIPNNHYNNMIMNPQTADALTVDSRPKPNMPLTRGNGGVIDGGVNNDNVAMSRSLWIGNIDSGLLESEIRTVFEPFGTIESIKILLAKDCAFVNYQNISDAIKAKDALQGTAIRNLIMRIGFGKADGNNNNNNSRFHNSNTNANGNNGMDLYMNENGASRGGGGGNNGNYASNVNSQSNIDHVKNNGLALTGNSLDGSINLRSVWVGQIDPDCTSEMLMEIFSEFGRVESCRILDSKNCAFINFFNAENADKARRAMNGARLGTTIVKTGFAKANGGTNNSNTATLTFMTTTTTDTLPTSSSAPLKSFTPTPVTALLPSSTSTLSSSSFKTLLDTHYNLIKEELVVISTQDVPIDEFRHPIPLLPASVRLAQNMNSAAIKEYRRRMEHNPITPIEVHSFTEQMADQILAAAVDPIGNVLVQNLIEKGLDETRDLILHILGPYLATVGIHKNGTWVVQRIIGHCQTNEQRQYLTRQLRQYIVPLMQDQFGNYVAQCCLSYGPAQNQFIFDALYHRCVDIATSQFGSRAMKSCLDSTHVSMRQKKFVTMAMISHALKLVHDINGVIVIQWLLDSDLPGRRAFITPVLKGHLATLCLSKHASSVVAKLIQPTGDSSSARDLVIDEIFNSPLLSNLLQEPMSAAIILRAITTAKTDQRVKMAYLIEPQLRKLASKNLAHLQKITEEVEESLSLVDLGLDFEEKNGARRNNQQFPRMFQSSINNVDSTLLSHAVGGPVTNRQVLKNSLSTTTVAPSISSSYSQRRYSQQNINVTSDVIVEQDGGEGGNNTKSINSDNEDGYDNKLIKAANRSLSFGSFIVPIMDEKKKKNLGANVAVTSQTDDDQLGRIKFGPSLAQRLDMETVYRPPTPS